MVHYIAPEKWILAGGTDSKRQREYGIFHRPRDVAVQVMPFGLCNAPETFEQLLESILRGLNYDACLVYLDHVTDIGHTFQEQFTNLQKVFLR